MSLSPIGAAVLMAREGRVLKAYKDTEGIWTIAAGVTSASGLIKVTPGLLLSSAECDALNARAFAMYAGYVDKALSGTIPEQHTYDALVSFCYNVGPGNFRKSTCLKRIKAGDLKGARAAMMMWDKPSVIISRRRAEADQLVTPYSVRLPSRVAGQPAIKVLPAGAPVPPVTGPRIPVALPPSIPPAPPRQPDFTMPRWFLALAAFLDAVMAAKPAKRAF